MPECTFESIIFLVLFHNGWMKGAEGLYHFIKRWKRPCWSLAHYTNPKIQEIWQGYGMNKLK